MLLRFHLFCSVRLSLINSFSVSHEWNFSLPLPYVCTWHTNVNIQNGWLQFILLIHDSTTSSYNCFSFSFLFRRNFSLLFFEDGFPINFIRLSNCLLHDFKQNSGQIHATTKSLICKLVFRQFWEQREVIKSIEYRQAKPQMWVFVVRKRSDNVTQWGNRDYENKKYMDIEFVVAQGAFKCCSFS